MDLGTHVAGEELAQARMEEKDGAADAVSFTKLSNALAKKGDVTGAEGALARMAQKGVAAVVTYSTMMGARAKKGDTASAERARARKEEKGAAANDASYTKETDGAH